MHKLFSIAATAAALLALPLAAHATVYQFNASLAGSNESTPNAAVGTGVATLFYNDFNTLATADDTYNFALSAFNLTGTATGYHIHAAAPAGANAGVVVNLALPPFLGFISGGSLLVGGNGVAAPNASFLSNLQASLAYVNVHTAAFGNGEIRGQLIQVAVVPEPSTYAMLGAGLLMIGAIARRRAKKAA